MNGFDAGALVFKIQAVGARLFQRETEDADRAVAKLGQSADKSAASTTELGNSTEKSGRKARAAKSELDEQAKATSRAGDESKKAKPKQEEQAKATERQAESAQKLSLALLAAGVAVSAVVALSVAKFVEFDQGMSNVAAATMATAEEQRILGDAALEAGADTAYSAREAADAEEELAKAGLLTSEIVGGGLTGSLALAAAGQLEVARSATIMATTLKQFKLPAEEAGHVSDLLAAGAGKAQGSVDDLALALQYVGPVAAGLGLSIEETTGTLALFAEQGQLGERAGTGLRGVLMALTAPSAIAARTMKDYNVEIFDGAGRMKSLGEVSQELQNAFGDLTEAERSQALGRIFGNEQITAARVLYEGGAQAVAKWTDEVDDSGYAAEQAAKRQDNLAGDIEKLGGAFDTALIKTGSGANDVLRDGVQIVTSLIDGYGELPEPIQATTLTTLAGAGAMLLFSGAALGGISRFAELKKTLEAANLTMGRTTLIAGGVGLALTAVVTVVGMVAAAQADARQKAQSYADALSQGADAARDLVAQSLTVDQTWLGISRGSAADAAEKFGISLEELADAASGDADALASMNDVIRAGRGDQEAARRLSEEHALSMVDVSAASTLVAESIDKENAAQKDGAKILQQKKEITDDVVDSERTAAEAYSASADEVAGYKDELDQLIDKVLELNGINRDAASAQIDYQNSLADLDEVIRKATEGVDENEDGVADYTLTLDQATRAGRDNMEMLLGLAADAEDAAKKQYELDGNTDKYRETLESSHQALMDRAEALGLNADEARALADEILGIPSESEWKMIAETSVAMQQAEAMAQKIRDIPNDKTVYLYIEEQAAKSGAPRGQVGAAYGANGFVLESYANGGMREHHVAQIAKAGTWRVWAEDETGGEAYIPLAPSKRARSTAILAETASRFGYELAPRAQGSSGAAGAAPAAGLRPIRIDQTFNMPAGLDETAVTTLASAKTAKVLRGLST